MSDPSPPYSHAASRFYANYLRLLEKNGIPERQRRWYVRHIEAFIKAQKRRRINHKPAAPQSHQSLAFPVALCLRERTTSFFSHGGTEPRRKHI